MTFIDTLRKRTNPFFSSVEGRPLSNKVICNLMIVSIILCCVQATMQSLSSGALTSAMATSIYEFGVYSVINIVLIEFTTIGMFMMVGYDMKGKVRSSRMTCRILIVLLVLSLLACLIINGIVLTEAFYIFQFACVISYQIVTDPHLKENVPWVNPFSKAAREKARADGVYARTSYLPLNFFNIFWVFFCGCIIGLGIETWFCWFERGVIESRAGLLWGPFSPIYGCGAVLMTIALNRFWNKPGIIIFVVSGLIGAGFEWFTSWYMEVAFGVCAWDYSDAILNLQGRTDLAHAIAWGALGFLWIRLALPVMMRIVDAIRLGWRASLTIVVFSFMLVNAVMTTLALDCWSQRQAGHEPENELQVFYAQNFDNDWMQRRFETMSVTKEASIHQQIDESLDEGDDEQGNS